MCTLFTSQLHRGAFSRFANIEPYTQLDETFQVRYYMPMFTRKSVKGNFPAIKMYRVGCLYSQKRFSLRFSPFGAVETFPLLGEPNLLINNFVMIGRQIFKLWVTPNE